MSVKFFYRKMGEIIGQEVGPVTLEEFLELKNAGRVGNRTFVRRADDSRWVSGENILSLLSDTEKQLCQPKKFERIPRKKLLSNLSIGAKIRRKPKNFFATHEAAIAWVLLIVSGLFALTVVVKSFNWMPVLVACMWIVGVLACILLFFVLISAFNGWTKNKTDSEIRDQLGRVALFIVLIFFLFHASNPHDTGFSPATSDFQKKYRAEQELRRELKDPKSMEVIETRVVGNLVYIKYRAKNSFGGYDVDEYITDIRWSSFH